MNTSKSQSAMEYLTTYGWAILIMMIVIAVLFEMGLFNPNVPAECVLSDFSCISFSISTNGILTINIEQTTAYPINITAIGCNSDPNTDHMTKITPQAQLQISANIIKSVQCWSDGSEFTGSSGSRYTGYVIINYTNLQTGFPYVEPGNLVQVVK